MASVAHSFKVKWGTAASNANKAPSVTASRERSPERAYMAAVKISLIDSVRHTAELTVNIIVIIILH